MANYTNFTVETDSDGIALVTWDMPDKSMNVFTEEVMDELEQIVDQVTADEAVKGVVFTSGKETFSGGADLTMLQKMLALYEQKKATNEQEAIQFLFDNAGRMTWLFRKIETSGKPWVSAINGTCMGGAFELSLACHGRVAADSDKVKMALPEVKVGIFPGAGGTQRVMRLTDPQSGLQMLTSGQNLTPKKAKSMGLIHEIAAPDQLIEAAKAMIRNGLKPVQPWDEKGFKLPGGPVYSAAGANLWPPAIAILRRETYGNYPGAAAILKAAYEGLLVPFDTGLRIEQRYFTQILRSTEARMMIRSLFVSLQELNKGARRPQGIPETKFTKIGVLGAGFMGAGIAFVTAKAGIPVVLLDREIAFAEKGKAHSAGLMDAAIKKGRATAEEKEQLLSLITPTVDYKDLEGCDLVIEAVFEDSEVKKGATEQTEAVIAESAIFASNTSTIPITSLAKNSSRPANFIGIHFFSPVDKMPLVEIIKGEKTSDEALARVFDYTLAIRKTPIVVNDSRGFFTSRVIGTFVNEAIAMLGEGIEPATIEQAGSQAGYPAPPLQLTDELNMKLMQKIAKETEEAAKQGDTKLGASRHPALDVVDWMIEQGRPGRLEKAGFYEYDENGKRLGIWQGVRDHYKTEATLDVPLQDLIDRMLFAEAIETQKCFDEGVLETTADANIGSILGIGFPAWTGGVAQYIVGYPGGKEGFVKRAEELAAKYGERFNPPASLRS